MSSIELSENEWGQVMNLMSYGPGRECIPLLNKIGEQLRQQVMTGGAPQQQTIEETRAGNGLEVRHE